MSVTGLKMAATSLETLSMSCLNATRVNLAVFPVSVIDIESQPSDRGIEAFLVLHGRILRDSPPRAL